MSDFLWVEKYRPKKISDCILSEDLKNTFSKFLDSKELSSQAKDFSKNIDKFYLED